MLAVILSAVVVAVAIVAALAVVAVLARRSAPATDGTPAPWKLQRTAEQPVGSGEHAPLPDPTTWQSATVSDLEAAEDLLDRAEAEGYTERELIVLGNDTFLVRWRGLAAE